MLIKGDGKEVGGGLEWHRRIRTDNLSLQYSVPLNSDGLTFESHILYQGRGRCKMNEKENIKEAEKIMGVKGMEKN